MPDNGEQPMPNWENSFGLRSDSVPDIEEGIDAANADRIAWEDMLERQRAIRKFQEETCFSRLRSLLVRGVALVIVVLALVTLLIYVWHLLAPDSWQWLAPDRVARIERLALSILSGVIASAAIAWLFQKH